MLSNLPSLLLPHDRPVVCLEASCAHELRVGAAKRVGRQVPAVRDSRVLQGVQLPCVCTHTQMCHFRLLPPMLHSVCQHTQSNDHSKTIHPSLFAQHCAVICSANAQTPVLAVLAHHTAATSRTAIACMTQPRDHQVCARHKLTVTRGLSANICRPVELSRMRCRIARTAESPNVSPTRPTQSPRAGLQRWSNVFSGASLGWVVAGNVAAGQRATGCC